MWENSKNRFSFCKILKILVSSHVVYHEAVHMTEIQTIQNKIYEVQENEIVLYRSNETTRIEVRLDDETVWLTQQQMAEGRGIKTQTPEYA